MSSKYQRRHYENFAALAVDILGSCERAASAGSAQALRMVELTEGPDPALSMTEYHRRLMDNVIPAVANACAASIVQRLGENFAADNSRFDLDRFESRIREGLIKEGTQSFMAQV